MSLAEILLLLLVVPVVVTSSTKQEVYLVPGTVVDRCLLPEGEQELFIGMSNFNYSTWYLVPIPVPGARVP